MKAKNLSIILVVTLFLSGCVVYSFYPLYTEKDLFPNEILTGNWVDDENTEWNFKHAFVQGKTPKEIDSTSYILYLKDKDEKVSEFNIHIIKLGGHYFLDFYLEEFIDDDNLELEDLHIIPVHTFAKLTVEENQLQINWFDQDWLEDLIEENKIRIHHENNDDFILLTAKPKELQKFVTKYVNSEEAFKDGMEALLTRK
ncbi:MAG: hypothetical protein HN778_11975 [Prolixibacteraceae bacterium]|jgi:hypothetical protein|nr:hypothetical protein [Prolixibacteraceae bacterium]MBT6766720.1 hypothetical protein [Prolixibacteraceae bacterium]MBT7000611.1 hypothetical protein [Prolixibacteraceae bacterium]MBT7395543.1 hypothetical protein [Prolixibacteraceae bacterium]